MTFSRISNAQLQLPSLLWAAAFLLNANADAQVVSNFVSLPPCRLIDTRDPFRGSLGPPSLIALAQRDFSVVSSSCSVPPDATAYSLNVTVVPHEPLSYLTVWPTGQTQPLVSTLNAYSGAVTANAAVVPAGLNGSISVFVTGNTELIVDINGYFAHQTTQAIDQLTQLVSAAQQQVSSVNAAVALAAQELSSVQRQVTSTNSGVSQAAQQISTLQQQVTTITSGGSLTGQQITLLQQQAASASTGIAQAVQQISSLQQQVTASNSGSAQAAQQLAQLQQQMSLVTAGVTQAQQLITSIQGDVTTVNTGATQTAQQLSSLQQQVTTLSSSAAQVPSLVLATTSILGSIGINSSQRNVALGTAPYLPGSQNTTIGDHTLHLNGGGSANTAVGSGSLALNTTGNANVALGVDVLSGNETGNRNIAIGNHSAGLIGNGDDVIEIGNPGQPGDSAVIRIGTQGVQQNAFMAGVYQSGTDPYGVSVLVDDTGMLGTFQSSIRYKEDVRNLGTDSDKLMQLRPVKFRYKKPSKRGDKPVQYGLIAEEVELVFPTLVAHDSQGRAETVQYHQLPALLLNEFQKQHLKIEKQDQMIEQQGKQIRLLIKKYEATATK